jgi:hypothetical protein
MMAEKFRELDRLLTGKVKLLERYPQSAEKVIDHHVVLYLSDGGYSRFYGFFHSDDMFHLTLGGESREEVKAKSDCPEVRKLIADIENAVNTWVQTNED